MTTNKPGIKIYEPSEKGVTAMRKASFRNTGPNRYVRLSDYEVLQAECEKLVEALTELCDEIDKHGAHAAISKTSISWFKRKARKALAAYRQGGEE